MPDQESKRKFNWNSDKILSFSAMSISLITLIIFIYQTNLMRKQNALSIMPYLGVSTSNNKAKHTYEINLINQGVGPAIIESVTFFYQGKKYNLVDYDNEAFAFYSEKIPALDSIKAISYSTLDPGIAIPANTVYNVVRVGTNPADYQLMLRSITQLIQDGLDYEIIYKSIQGERWMININSVEPRRLR